ncbi:helix-turn-helix domain-containing protein [Dawidia soli]|uniref:Helix-turn-helix domain-containing protein n=1 Tax=Dawidia soli TaxID=2782352 RepID=A0AAP2GFA9_9BACT|nr:helix-turn-helix domain-containing protein [Dawidia soli]MBT1689224.1 helix-turn-helix domain-containing protein [Dawidia soli]
MSRYITLQDLEVSQRSLLANIKKLLLESAGQQLTLEYVRANEACRMLRISENTLRSLRRRNAIPFVKAGNAVYYRVTDLHRFLESNNTSTLKNR